MVSITMDSNKFLSTYGTIEVVRKLDEVDNVYGRGKKEGGDDPEETGRIARCHREIPARQDGLHPPRAM